MSMVGFPLLLIPLAIYNIIVFLMPGVSLAEPLVRLTLMSGAELPVTSGDILLTLAVLMLLFEVIKGARPGAKYLTDHLLSLIVFGGAIAEFLLWPRFGTSTYFLLALLSLADFLSGIALRSRRGAAATSSRREARAPVAVSEPQFDPVPHAAPAPVPAAASVAESVLLDHPGPTVPGPTVPEPTVPEPKVLQPSPEVPSPGLQPGNGQPPSPELPPH